MLIAQNPILSSFLSVSGSGDYHFTILHERRRTMKNILLINLLVIAFSLVQAQDTKRMKTVQNALTKGDYNGMLKHLDKFPDNEKNTAEALYYRGVAYDSLHRYESALEAYRSSSSMGYQDSTVAGRINDIETGLAERAACTVCHGKGYTMVEQRCGLCQGSGISKSTCSSCSGSKYVECPNCGGGGKVQNSQGSYINCSVCSGRGKQDCNRCNMTGVLEGPCKMCKGGVIRTEVKCGLHL